jgi:AcrR family transcriptional regulator
MLDECQDAARQGPGGVAACYEGRVMKSARARSSERISRQQVAKFAERRAELAEAALKTLSELGYARTSLREIAQNTDFSHGVLHYYFTDKVDLIMCCVRQYKAVCVTRYDEIVATARTARQLELGFAAGMAQTLRAEGHMHRLWYDLRSQSLFETSFREDVRAIDHSLERMIWRIVTAHAALAGVAPRVSPAVAYALFDGLFQQALLKHLHGDAAAGDALRAQVVQALAELTVDAAARPRGGEARLKRVKVAGRG